MVNSILNSIICLTNNNFDNTNNEEQQERSNIDVALMLRIGAVLFIFGSFAYSRYSAAASLPILRPRLLEAETLTVSSADILKIGRALVGLRHVSSKEHAEDNKNNGYSQGCALNISFCNTESSPFSFCLKESKFHNLDRRVQKGEDCSELIKDYDKAIRSFIRTSILMDFKFREFSYRNYCSSLLSTHLMLVKTHWYSASDCEHDQYGGLGRFAKENVPSENITLLPPIIQEDLPELSQETQSEIISESEHGKILERCVNLHMNRLLSHLRNEFSQENYMQRHLFRD